MLARFLRPRFRAESTLWDAISLEAAMQQDVADRPISLMNSRQDANVCVRALLQSAPLVAPLVTALFRQCVVVAWRRHGAER